MTTILTLFVMTPVKTSTGGHRRAMQEYSFAVFTVFRDSAAFRLSRLLLVQVAAGGLYRGTLAGPAYPLSWPSPFRWNGRCEGDWKNSRKTRWSASFRVRENPCKRIQSFPPRPSVRQASQPASHPVHPHYSCHQLLKSLNLSHRLAPFPLSS